MAMVASEALPRMGRNCQWHIRFCYYLNRGCGGPPGTPILHLVLDIKNSSRQSAAKRIHPICAKGNFDRQFWLYRQQTSSTTNPGSPKPGNCFELPSDWLLSYCERQSEGSSKQLLINKEPGFGGLMICTS